MVSIIAKSTNSMREMMPAGYRVHDGHHGAAFGERRPDHA
jgi:hypothetical protein